MSIHSPISSGKTVDDIREAARPFVVFVARIGYAARGFIYLLVSSLALFLAFGLGGEATGSSGALHNVGHRPLGAWILAALALGFFSYSLWCFIEAIEDPERRGNDLRGLLKRVPFLGRAFTYIALTFSALHAMFHSSPEPGSGAKGWTARLMSFPAGILLVAAIGIGVLVATVFQFRRAFRRDLDRKLGLRPLRPIPRAIVLILSRIGIAARGVVFLIIGGFLLVAAYHTNPADAAGLGEALQFVAAQAYGRWLLAILSAGLACYGLHQFLLAAFRQIDL